MTKEIAIEEVVPTFPPTLENIEQIEARMLDLPQVDCPLTHIFTPGSYYREILMPAGAFVIGHRHKTEHVNIVLSGKASVLCDGQMMHIEAPYVFVSKPGVRKLLYIRETMRWATVHPTNETDLQKLEAELIEKSGAYLEHAAEIEQLKNKVKEDANALPA